MWGMIFRENILPNIVGRRVEGVQRPTLKINVMSVRKKMYTSCGQGCLSKSPCASSTTDENPTKISDLYLVFAFLLASPSLKVLDIKHLSQTHLPNPTDHRQWLFLLIDNFLSRSSCRLTPLGIRGMGLNQEQIIAVLQHSSIRESLLSLDLHQNENGPFVPVADDLLEFLTWNPDSPVGPRLHPCLAIQDGLHISVIHGVAVEEEEARDDATRFEEVIGELLEIGRTVTFEQQPYISLALASVEGQASCTYARNVKVRRHVKPSLWTLIVKDIMRSASYSEMPHFAAPRAWRVYCQVNFIDHLVQFCTPRPQDSSPEENEKVSQNTLSLEHRTIALYSLLYLYYTAKFGQ
ncbi:hypothetical protein C8J56DRAFT_1100889 [Mycena floridula]|nr:hypothetical protein C8J56DRAFT_1100889 [Mycena floridula]